LNIGGSSPAVHVHGASTGEDEAGAAGGQPRQRPSRLLAGRHLGVPASWKRDDAAMSDLRVDLAEDEVVAEPAR